MHNRLRRRRLLLLIIGVVVVDACVLVGIYWHYTRLPKRFATVVEGQLYRSGRVSPRQLARLKDEYAIGRVVCLLDSDVPETQAERAEAERLGLDWRNVPLTGDGASTPGERELILALLTAPDAPPTLVHCAAGANRTGLAVGLYRICVQGWTYEQALDEMRAIGFEDEPQHENLRQALAAAAAEAESQPAP